VKNFLSILAASFLTSFCFLGHVSGQGRSTVDDAWPIFTKVSETWKTELTPQPTPTDLELIERARSGDWAKWGNPFLIAQEPHHEFIGSGKYKLDEGIDNSTPTPTPDISVSEVNRAEVEKQADAGNPTACSRMAYFYLCTQKLDWPCKNFDLINAEKYARKTVDSGGAINLCDSWAYGVEFPQDLTFAVKCFATQGDLNDALWLIATKFPDSSTEGIRHAQDFIRNSSKAQTLGLKVASKLACPEYLSSQWSNDDCFYNPGMNGERDYATDLEARRYKIDEMKVSEKFLVPFSVLEKNRRDWEAFSKSWAKFSLTLCQGSICSIMFHSILESMEKNGRKELARLSSKQLAELEDSNDSPVKITEELVVCQHNVQRQMLIHLDSFDAENAAIRKENMRQDEESSQTAWQVYKQSKLTLMKAMFGNGKNDEQIWRQIEAQIDRQQLTLFTELLRGLKKKEFY
jgi:hypothetical protein